MTFKDPEEELAQFLAQLPAWAENVLWQKPSKSEFLAWVESDLFDRRQEIEDQYESLLRRIPKRWREYCKAQEDFGRRVFAHSEKPRPGRTRLDALAEQAAELMKRGMNLPQVVAELKKLGIETTPDALRHLLSRRSKPDKI